jgi:hypothetical protein
MAPTEPMLTEIEQARAIMKVINERMKPLDCIEAENKESLSYRIAEIMTASKNLYTGMLPRLITEDKPEDMWEMLVEMRMHFLHITDLIAEFDTLFLESIESEEDEEEGCECDDEEV